MGNQMRAECGHVNVVGSSQLAQRIEDQVHSPSRVRASVRGANPMTSAGTPIRDTAERDETKTMRSAPARPQEGLSSPPHGD